jgi:membrane protein insertase Oxa1/YidC/SpoIIIJ
LFDFLIDLVGTPLGWVMKLIYDFVGNYGVAIILFTLVTKLITLPIYYKQQKNMAHTQLVQPKLAKLREKYGYSAIQRGIVIGDEKVDGLDIRGKKED